MIYAEVIGDPIAQSKSPLIHRHWLAGLGMAGDYRHAHVTAEALPDYLASRRSDPDWRGCNVTMPHKQAVMALIDALDPLAARVGAVNTIIPRDGKLVGYNTDVDGFLEPLHPLPSRDADGFRGHAIVLGAGGAARAVVCALWDQGYQIDILNRDIEKARKLAGEFGAPITGIGPLLMPDAPTFAVTQPATPSSAILINTTALGMQGQPPLAVSLENVSVGVTVYDIVTVPLETPLLAEARRLGLRTVDGLAMLIGQAARAFALFYGAEPLRGDGDAGLRAVLTGEPVS